MHNAAPQTVVDGETGILVDPGDVAGMREAVRELLAHPEEARRLGQNARQRIDEELNLDVYVGRIAEVLRAQLWPMAQRPCAAGTLWGTWV